MEQSNIKVRVGCDTMLKVIKEIDENAELQEIFGSPVSGALSVIAENGDLLIEDGGAIKLTDEEKERFISVLGSIVKHRSPHTSPGRGNAERIRIRCDVLASIINELDRNGELRAIFGGSVSEAIVVIAEGDDLRIEVGDSIKLTEGQSSVFLGILNRVVENRTAIEDNPMA
jgi:hypothetical protein